LFQQDLSFLYQPGDDMLGGGFAGIFFLNLVKVIIVNGQPVGIIFGGAQC